MADKRRFNKDMGDYLKQRHKNPSSGSFKLKVSRRQTIGDAHSTDVGIVEIESERMSFFEKISYFFSRDDEPRENPDELSEEELVRLQEMHEKTAHKKQVEIEVEEEVGNFDDSPRVGVFEKIASFLGFGQSHGAEHVEEFDPADYAEKESEIVIYQEKVKELVHITHGWLEMLTLRKKRDMKDSPEFKRYKQLLKELDLVKEKRAVEKEMRELEK